MKKMKFSHSCIVKQQPVAPLSAGRGITVADCDCIVQHIFVQMNEGVCHHQG